MSNFIYFAISEHFEFLVRLITSVFCGFVIGFERKNRNKEAGIRTHVIVALASCLMMIISKYAFYDLGDARFDGSRVASQIVSGIGFLGAGMIFVHKNSIKGLTTAAGIWATSAIGMAIGAGMYFVGIITTIMMVFLQFFLHIKFKALQHSTTEEYIFRVKNIPNSIDIVKNIMEKKSMNFDFVSISKKEDDIKIGVEITYSQSEELIGLIEDALEEEEIIEVYTRTQL